MLSIKEVHELTGIAASTIRLYCRTKKFPNAEKTPTPFGDFWIIPETDLTFVSKRDRGRPKNQ